MVPEALNKMDGLAYVDLSDNDLTGELASNSTESTSPRSFSFLGSASSVLDKISGTFRGSATSKKEADAFLENRIHNRALSRNTSSGAGAVAADLRNSKMKRMSGVSINQSRGSTRISEIIQHRQSQRLSLSVSSRHTSMAIKR
jgi:hypothetical protein